MVGKDFGIKRLLLTVIMASSLFTTAAFSNETIYELLDSERLVPSGPSPVVDETWLLVPSHYNSLSISKVSGSDRNPVEFYTDSKTASNSTLQCSCVRDCDSYCKKEHLNTGFIDFNTYWDTREFAVTTLNIGAKLANDFEYFQLLNMFSPINSGSYDWTDYYTELNLRRPISKDSRYLKQFDWTIQYADGSGPRGVLRLGAKWRFQDTSGPVGNFFKDVLKAKYAIDFHLIETDGTGWQMEHTYRRTFFEDQVYISGVADHNINNNGKNSTWVTEHQIGMRLFDQLYAVAEYRYSSLAPSGSKSGWGIGIEYVVKFKGRKI